MIRVLYVSTSTALGGAEKTICLLATRLDPQRFETAGVVSVKPKGEYSATLEAAGCRTYSLNVNSIVSPRALRLTEFIREARPHLVHAIMYQAIQLCRAV